MKALIKAQLALLSLAMAVNLQGQTTLFTFNTTPTWSSTYTTGTDAQFKIATGGAAGTSKYLSAKTLTAAGGNGIRVIKIIVPMYSMLQITGYMKAPPKTKPWSMSFAFRLGSYTANSFHAEPANWSTIMSFSDSTVNGNSNTWRQYGAQVYSNTDTVLSLAFSLASDSIMQVGFDEVQVDPLYALPVKLIGFDAKKLRNSIQLHWRTASEIDNSEFDIERSADGSNFSVIGNLPGHGNSQQQIDYTFTDEQLPLGTLYYRLRALDFNGKSTYSDIIEVKDNMEKVSGFRAYPNPFDDNLRWEYNTAKDIKYVLRMTDMSGRKVYSQVIEGGLSTGQIELGSNLPHGLYILTIEDGISLTQNVIVKH